MSFTFNWAGVSIPQVQRADNTARTIAAGSNFGTAARGARNSIYDAEYAKMLDEYQKGDPKVAEIEAQIRQLEADNARLMQIRSQLV